MTMTIQSTNSDHSLIHNFDCISLGAQIRAETYLRPLFSLIVYFQFEGVGLIVDFEGQFFRFEGDFHDVVLAESEETGVDVVLGAGVRPGVAVVGQQVTSMPQYLIWVVIQVHLNW